LAGKILAGFWNGSSELMDRHAGRAKPTIKRGQTFEASKFSKIHPRISCLFHPTTLQRGSALVPDVQVVEMQWCARSFPLLLEAGT